MSVIQQDTELDLDQMATDFHRSVNRRRTRERLVNWLILAGTVGLAVLLVLFA